MGRHYLQYVEPLLNRIGRVSALLRRGLPELRRALYAAHPHFAAVDQIARGDVASIRTLARHAGKVTGGLGFRSTIESFYFSNPIARASALMAECAAIASGKSREAAE